MNIKSEPDGLYKALYFNTILAAFIWSIIILTSYFWNIHNRTNQTKELINLAAHTHFEKDYALRMWISRHGSLYAEVDNQMQPSPYLMHVPDRDIFTPSGKKLTLISPEYILRKMTEEFSDMYGVRGKITGLNPLRPENKPDNWEKSALSEFRDGLHEKKEITLIDDKPFIRLMHPLITEQGCLKCHEKQGYKIGDLQGGISVSLPIDSYIIMENNSKRTITLTHGAFWILGIIAVGLISRRSKIRIKERISAEQALSESEERFRAFMDNLPVLTYIKDKTFRYIYGNSSVLEFTGKSHDEFIGSTARDYFSKNVALQNEEQDKLVLKKKQALKPREWSGEINGKTFWLREIKFPIFRKDDEILIGGLALNITELKQREEEERTRQQQLIQTHKLAAIGEVVTGVAHEINNPNSFISYNIPLLQDTWTQVEPVLREYSLDHPDWRIENMKADEIFTDMKEIIESIKIGSERINKIVTNLKDFARIEDETETQAVDINEVVSASMMIIGAQARKSVGKININLAEGLPEVEGNINRIEQVIVNLISNALHAIPDKETGILNITTRHIKSINSVLIEVEDNGKGIEKDIFPKIFDPFFTTRRTEGGTGIGLSVSNSFIKDHNGIIDVRSVPGRGTKMTVILPVDSDKKIDLKPLIICVDDDPDILGMFKSFFLDFENLYAEATDDPDSVLSFIDEHPEVEMVISDINMPSLDGWKLLRQLKEKHPLIPMILFSGFPDAIAKEKSHDLKPDYLLEKPIRLQKLDGIVKSLMRPKI